MFTQEESGWQQIANPATGKPFQSYSDYSTWAGGMEKQASAGAKDSAFPATVAGYGQTHTADGDFAYGGQTGQWSWGDTTGVRNYGDSYGFTTGANGGQTNPGAIGNFYVKDLDGHKAGDVVFGGMDNGQNYSGGTRWSPTTDYGLGPDAKGIIPIGHDSNGTPTSFGTLTPGGGGKVFESLSDAQAAVAAYTSWYATQHPNDPSVVTPSTFSPTGTTAASTTAGALTTPGIGEKTFNPGDYEGPLRADAAWGNKPTQPTAAQQYWTGMSGSYQNPDELKGVYDRAEQQAQTTLDRKASSSGWSDSSAAAKATANIGMNFNDAYVKARDAHIAAGGQLASAADTSGNAQTNAWLNSVNAASGIDSSDLARTTAKQTSANSAQTLEQNRLTGGFDRSMDIANNMASIASAGLSQASQQDMAYKMADLEGQMRLNNMDYATATAQLNEYMSTMGLSVQSANAIKNAWATKNGQAAKAA